METDVACSCPSCRHEAKDFEDLPEDASQADEESEADSEDGSESGSEAGSNADEEEEEAEEAPEIPYNPAKYKIRVVTDLDEYGDEVRYTVLDGPEPDDEATKIQKLFRGFQDRRLLRRALNFNFLPSGDLFA